VVTAFTKLRARAFGAIRTVLAVLGVAMLLSFPANRVHRYEVHFRTPEVRREITRSTYFGRPKVTATEQAAVEKPAPSPPTIVVVPASPEPVENFQIASESLPTRLLLRIKPRSARSSGSDPLS
jgi:hypothetical protein